MSDDKQLECFKVSPVGILGQNNAPVQRVLSDGASKSRLMPRVPRVLEVMWLLWRPTSWGKVALACWPRRSMTSTTTPVCLRIQGLGSLLDTTGRMFPLVPGIFRRTPDTMDVACS